MRSREKKLLNCQEDFHNARYRAIPKPPKIRLPANASISRSGVRGEA